MTNGTECPNIVHPKTLRRFAVYHVKSTVFDCSNDLLYLGKDKDGWQFIMLSRPLGYEDRVLVNHPANRSSKLLMDNIHLVRRRA